MNGGVNGMMEESKEECQADHSEHVKEVKIDTSDEVALDANQSEHDDSSRNNHIDNGTEPTESSFATLADNTNSICSMEKELGECSTVTDSQPTLEENRSDKALTNHCTNSNESFIDTVDSGSKSEAVSERETENCLTSQDSLSNEFKKKSPRNFDEDDVGKMTSNNGVSTT